MSLRTPLARVRHLGSAKDGTHHWWAQRLTALALIPLTLWFVASVISLVGAEHGAVVAWIGHPVSAVLLLILIVAVFYHAYLGLQIVIEDYVHNKGAKLALMLAVQGLSLLLGTAAVLAVLSILL
jgi:succinate dehydrogenase / fumarate reductase membrane anchor subunit